MKCFCDQHGYKGNINIGLVILEENSNLFHKYCYGAGSMEGLLHIFSFL